MTKSDLGVALNYVVALFKYIEDKDVFQTFYAVAFSKRLFLDVSTSTESEASMISKLKEVCGLKYINKLQRMFTDISLSKDLTDEFNERMQIYDDMNINFSIMVLGTNFWPLSATSSFIIPPEIFRPYDRFSKLSLDELMTATGISKDILLQVLALLVTAKILLNEDVGQYNLNLNFKSKKLRVLLNQPIETEVKAESSELLKIVEEDRQYVIQAIIVRIMKERKQMGIQPLIKEVVSHISKQFAPKIPDIKKVINTLLEDEYIERIDGATDTFAYV
ncbi:hypothetical protein DFJ58DRAFT_869210 [Suillus subalutaceus]|uniref:uncharacterized protein n=1 Tax=Suillus subalutaceus TaxID=48586 RepID=UPI001B8745A7|nr:uncharacterized protein DFJ58DRAFT_869210 [Suillus subalutaceus]KAG1863167.1 hypothetical protein DFJ58DRAFT_869210 [Suillus subalutaceus]